MTAVRKAGPLSDEELLDQSGPAIEVRGLSSIFGDHVVHENLDLTVKRGTVVKWRWPGVYEAGDVHDVKLKSGPKRAKKFHSEAAATDFSFKRKLKVAGNQMLAMKLKKLFQLQ